MNKTLCLVLSLVLTLTTAAVWSASKDLTNQIAPDFTLKSLDGQNIKLSEHRGEVILINFWASWCGPCRQEMPLLDELHQKYSPMGFSLYGVNVEEDSEAAKKMLGDLSVSFPILFDTENDVSKAYDVIAMPTTVIVDRDGMVHYIHRGYKPGDENTYQDAIRQAFRK